MNKSLSSRQTSVMAKQTEIGKEGEAAARKYLEEHGYTILQMNWHWHHYELDIVAAKAGELVVVEVKTRVADYWVDPADAIDRGKIKRIVAAADAYVRLNQLDWPVRFDIMILLGSDGAYQIEHIEDAFYAPCR